RHCVAAAMDRAGQRWAMGLEHDRGLRAAIPGPMHLVAGNAHDVASLASIASSIDKEKHLAGDDVVHLLTVMHMRAGVVARRPLGEHDAGLGAINFLRAQYRLSNSGLCDLLGHLHVAAVNPIIWLVGHLTPLLCSHVSFG